MAKQKILQACQGFARLYFLGGKSPRIDSEIENEDNYRGPASSLTEDLRSELDNLKPTRSAVVDDEDEDDSALSYFARLAE